MRIICQNFLRVMKKISNCERREKTTGGADQLIEEKTITLND